jgi:hypothetical protein
MFRHSFAHTSAVAGAPKAALVLAAAAAVAAALAMADAALLDGVRS